MILFLLSLLAGHPENAPPPVWDTYIQAEGIYGDYQTGGGAILFRPIVQAPDRLLFTELAGGRLRRQDAVSLGIGYRRLARRCLALGLNGFVDYTRSDKAAHLVQGSLGGEVLWRCWEAHTNVYIPWSNGRRVGEGETNDLQIVGTQIFDFQSAFAICERAHYGADVEVGYNLEGNRQRLRGFAGYYHFWRPGCRQINGPRLRLQAERDDLFELCGSRLIIAGEWHYDRVRHHEGAAWVGLRIPLGRWKRGCCRRLSSICRRMGDPVRRERAPILARDREQGPTEAEFLANIFFIEQNGTGPGTQTDPTNVVDAQAMAQEGDILFFLNDTGTIDPVTVILQDFQRAIGFDNSSQVTLSFGPQRDLTIFDLTGAGRATLTRGAGADIITLANNNQIFGLGLDGGDNGIGGTGIANANISEMVIENAGMSGINLSMSSDIIFTNSTIDGSAVAAITLSGMTGPFAASGIAMTTPGGATGLDISGGAASGSVSFASSTLAQASGGTAVDIDGTAANINLTGLTISNTSTAGLNVISVQNTTGGLVSFGPIDIDTASGADAVLITGNSGNVSFTTLDIDVTGGIGINGNNNLGNVTAGTVTIDNADGGIVLDTFSGAFTVTGTTTITDSTDHGVEVDDSSGDVTFNRLIVTDAANDGVNLDDNTGDFAINGGGSITFSAPTASSGIFADDIAGLTVRGTSASDRFLIADVATSGGAADYGIFVDDGASVLVDFVEIERVGPSGGAEGGIRLNDVTDSISITNSRIAEITANHAINIVNVGHSGTLTLDISDNEIAGNGVNFTTTNRAIRQRYNSTTAGNVVVTIENNQIDGVQMGLDIRTQGNSGTGASMNRFTINSNVIQDLNIDGMDYRVLGTSETEWFITNNTIDGLVNLAGTPNRGLDFVAAQFDGIADITIDNNIIRDFLQEGIRFNRGNGGSVGTLTTLVEDNTISDTGGRGIELQSGGGSTVNGTIRRNTVTNPSPDGIRARHNGAAAGSTLRVNIDDNEAQLFELTDSGAAGAVFELGGTLGQGMTFVNSDNGNIANNGNTTSGGAPTVSASGSITIVDPATIPLPPAP